jgi:hypothetical protein
MGLLSPKSDAHLNILQIISEMHVRAGKHIYPRPASVIDGDQLGGRRLSDPLR